jgi:hypothetical protein
MNIIEAQVLDDRHLELTQGLGLPPGSRVFITISSSEDQIQIMERESWTSRLLKNSLLWQLQITLCIWPK